MDPNWWGLERPALSEGSVSELPPSLGKFVINNGSDIIGGLPLTNCPDPNTSLGEHFRNPTILILYMVLGFVCCVFALITVRNYNSVRVFNKHIRTPNVSNTLWIIFFLAVATRATFDAFRYGLDVQDQDSDVNTGLYLASLVMDGVVVLCLTLALNHQKRYRSSIPVMSTHNNSKPDVSENHNGTLELVKTVLFAPETLYCLLFMIYLVFFYLNIDLQNEYSYKLFIAFTCLQKVPIVVLTSFIVFSRNSVDGPTPQSKLFLALGTVFNLTLVLPPSIWAAIFSQIITDECIFHFGTIVDFLQALYIVSMVLYFIFLRQEFQRNMEECIWTTVSQIQDTFDYRKF